VTTLELASVDARYPGKDAGRPVVKGVSLQVTGGEMLALIGPNGAGKSTLLRLASGLLRPLRGQVLLDGTDVATLTARDRARRIAVVPQEPPLPAGLTVYEMVGLGRTPYLGALRGPLARDREAVDWAISVTGIGALADRFVDELSGGECQRVVLARALAQQPRLLLLDEPTANMDLHHQVAMLELVRGLTRNQGIAVIAAVHDLQLAALYCDRLGLIVGGELVRLGPPEAVLTAESLLAAFRQQVVLWAHPTHGVPLVALVPNGNARRLESLAESPRRGAAGAN
jgi:iron complex transport system ATP-binding protein